MHLRSEAVLPEHKCSKGDLKTPILGTQWHAWLFSSDPRAVCTSPATQVEAGALWNSSLTRVVHQGTCLERSSQHGRSGACAFLSLELVPAASDPPVLSEHLLSWTDPQIPLPSVSLMSGLLLPAPSQPRQYLSSHWIMTTCKFPTRSLLWILLASLAKIGKGPECLT